MNTRYCIGCRHLNFEPPTPGGCGSTMTGAWSGAKAEFVCAHGHWVLYVNFEARLVDIEAAMKHAQTCPDFEERAI